ncbi:MAG: hypothetical protein LBE13_14215 [Bacteroidales bacterium]|jgi:folate-dependent phosphoribosylglycinamide formyltransferase PurN|nr:hypothetical protein [Bacteroidales bacterium]
MPYQLVVFRELVKSYSAEIVAIHWDKKKLTPAVLKEIDSVTYIPRSNFNIKREMLSFVEEIKPDLIYCSGWMDSYYSYVAKK